MPLTLIECLEFVFGLATVDKTTITMFLTVLKLALVDMAVFGCVLSLAMFTAKKPMTFIKFSITVGVSTIARELSFAKSSFVDLGFTEDTLTTSMRLACVPVTLVETTVFEGHLTLSLNLVGIKVTFIDISIDKDYFTFARSLTVFEDSFIQLSVCRLESAVTIFDTVRPLASVRSTCFVLDLSSAMSPIMQIFAFIFVAVRE